jgi:hypothetical protein
LHNFTIQTTRNIIRRLVFDVHRLSQFARPFPVGELASRVRVDKAAAVERDFFEARL